MRKTMLVLFSIVLVAAFALAACGPKTVETPTTVVEKPTAVPPTEVPPTAEPLGTENNPIIMALAPSATAEQLTTGGDAVAAKLKELTGYTFKVIIPNSYTALIEAMASGNAQIGWMPTFAYLLAKQKGAAEVALVVQRNGTDSYGAQFMANVASNFTPYFDPVTNKDTADAATALKQFDGKRPCFTDPLSTSGYIIPAGLLAQAGVTTKAPAAVQGHPAVVSALYVGGICDFGAAYIDARTSIQTTYPDVMDKIVIIWRTDNIIPNDNVSYSTSMPKEVADKVTQGLLAMAGSDEGRQILKTMGYEVGGLEVRDDTFYDAFRAAIQAAGIDITTMVK